MPGAVPATAGVGPSILVGGPKMSHPPTNADMARVIDHTQGLLANQASVHSGDPASKIVYDAQQVLASGKQLMMEKNAGENAQAIYLHGREATHTMQPQVHGAMQQLRSELPPTGQAKDVARNKMQSARNIVLLLVRSNEFRSSIMELFQLFGEALTWKAKQAQAGVAAGAPGQVTMGAAAPAGPTTMTMQTVLLPGETVTATFVPATLTPGVTPGLPVSAGTGAAELTRRAMVRARIRSILKTLASTEAYRTGVKNFFTMLDQANRMADTRAAGSLQGVKQATQDDVHVRAMLDNSKILLQSFAGGRSVDPFFINARGLFYLIRDDVALRGYLNEWRSYILESQTNPAILDDDLRLKTLLQKGRSYSTNLKAHAYAQNVMNEGRELLLAVRNDPTTTRFTNDLNTLFRDLFLNQDGRPALKMEMLSGLRDVLLGMLLEELRYIRLPRIAGATDAMQYSIEGISFNALTILPENVRITSKQSTSLKPRNVQTHGVPVHDAAKSKGYLKIKISNIATRFDNIQYWMKRTKGFPHIEDSGVASVILGDKVGQRGMRLSIYVATTYGAQYSRFFRVERVKCKVERMKLVVHQSQHRTLLRMLSPFINGAMRRRTETAVEENILKGVKRLEVRMQQFFETSSLGTAAPGVMQKMIPSTATQVQTAHGTVNPAGFAAPTSAH